MCSDTNARAVRDGVRRQGRLVACVQHTYNASGDRHGHTEARDVGLARV
jgi:hypothetical protein